MSFKYKLSVISYTYNHHNFIEETLNGFSIQTTTFPFNVILIDDASNDGSQDVIRNYINSNFLSSIEIYETDDYINIIATHKINHNFKLITYFLKYNFCKIKKNKSIISDIWVKNSQYIAFCEGDDYWTSPNKLQKQVEFLDVNPDCHFCYCKAKRYYQNIQQVKGYWGKPINTLDEALIIENAIPTLTICYSSQQYYLYREFISKYHKKWLLGDLPIFLWFVVHGGIHFIDEYVGVYRILEESASHSLIPERTETFYKDVLDIKLLYDQVFNQSKLTNNINDIFSRKLMNLYSYSFHSNSKSYHEFRKIKKKKISDYVNLMSGIIHNNCIYRYFNKSIK